MEFRGQGLGCPGWADSDTTLRLIEHSGIERPRWLEPCCVSALCWQCPCIPVSQQPLKRPCPGKDTPLSVGSPGVPLRSAPSSLSLSDCKQPVSIYQRRWHILVPSPTFGL